VKYWKLSTLSFLLFVDQSWAFGSKKIEILGGPLGPPALRRQLDSDAGSPDDFSPIKKEGMARDQSNSKRVEFHKYPPERRRRNGGTLYCGGGCCCCCCCLHSLGGLMGAAAVSVTQARRGRKIGTYWCLLLLLTVLSIFLFHVFDGALGIVFSAMMTPGIQLVCSVVITILLIVRGGENEEEQRAGLRTIGAITLWSLLGALAGFVAMILFFGRTQ
jgi:hypothetical protein